VRALIQRVAGAAVRVDGGVVARIGPGLLILLGVKAGDAASGVERMAERCAGLRIFEDDQGKMNRSLLETGGEALVVSQFTLYADTSRGRRPGFDAAARPEEAEPIYERFCQSLASRGVPTRRGVFGAKMEIDLTNQGPATFLLEGAGD
jgi:D-tyrosyl-tRNA(Tyr) deacylase